MEPPPAVHRTEHGPEHAGWYAVQGKGGAGLVYEPHDQELGAAQVMAPSNIASRRWTLAGCCLASALGLVLGLFVVPNVIWINALDCIEGDAACLPKATPGTLWQALPLLLDWLTFSALCWVVVASLGVGGLLALSRVEVPRWLQLAYLVGGIGLTLLLGVDGVYLVWGLRPGPGVVLVLAGLCLLAYASVQLRRAPHALTSHVR